MQEEDNKVDSINRSINSIVLDLSKNTATIVRDADLDVILEQLRKCRRSAMFVCVVPAKEEKKDEEKHEKEEKKNNVPFFPKTCQ